MPLLRRLPRLMRRAKPWVQAVRPGQQIYVDGEPVMRNPTQMYVRALVTPLTGRQQLVLAEGDRITERYMLYQDPNQTQFPGDDTQDANVDARLRVGDQVLAYGTPCVIEQSKDWLGKYIEAQAVKIDVGRSKKIDFPPDKL